MKLEITIKNTENIENFTNADIPRVEEIVTALLSTGGLTGVRGGQTIIHFDPEGIFQKVELKYFPFIRRKKKLTGGR